MRVHRRAFLVRQGSAAAGAASRNEQGDFMRSASLWTWAVLAFVAVFAVGCNHPPLASAGADMTVYAGSTVTLDGSRSMDVDHDPLTFKWVQTLGEPVPVTTNADGTGTFVAPSFR